jgi:hypothetical protein
VLLVHCGVRDEACGLVRLEAERRAIHAAFLVGDHAGKKYGKNPDAYCNEYRVLMED